MRLYDAHNHLQDARFAGRQPDLIRACRQVGVVGMVVNGTRESDWEDVERLHRRYPDLVRPSFGYHPWHVAERKPDWLEALRRALTRNPVAAVGEIGLDRWKPGLDFADQQRVFADQLRLATEMELPATIHCLKAWGRLFELLREGPLPARGFLLHSYGGPVEMVAPLAKLGARFSLPGYFAHSRKARQREVFARIPNERLLIETDAPDQRLPEERVRYPLTEANSETVLNHPADLAEVYVFAAEVRGCSVEELAIQVEANYRELFG